MRRLGGISLVGVAVAAAAVGLSAHATSAAPLAAKTRDLTYSCGVQKAKAVYIYAGTKLGKAYNPVTHDNASPGELVFATGGSTRDTAGNVYLTKTQARVVAAKKNSITVDTKKCQKAKKKIAFSAKGLPFLVTATPDLRGYTYQACDTAITKVFFRLQVHITNGIPTSAVFAVHNADKKGKPIALISWNPKKVTAHFESACNNLVS